MLLLLFIALDKRQQQTGLKALRVQNIYGSVLISAFPLVRHVYRNGDPIHKYLRERLSRTTTPLFILFDVAL